MPEMRVNFAEFPPHRRFPKRNANRQHKMSGMGHEQTSRHVRVMSGVSLKADIHQRGLHVRLVPKADLGDGERYVTGIPSDFYLYR